MSKKEIGSIPQIARTLVNHLPKEMDDELQRLITAAEAGQDTTIEIVDLLARHEITRDWMEEQINVQSRGRDISSGSAPSGYAALAGSPSFGPPRPKWVCPQNPRDHWLLVIQEGENPPTCTIHNLKMVRERPRNQ